MTFDEANKVVKRENSNAKIDSADYAIVFAINIQGDFVLLSYENLTGVNPFGYIESTIKDCGYKDVRDLFQIENGSIIVKHSELQKGVYTADAHAFSFKGYDDKYAELEYFTLKNIKLVYAYESSHARIREIETDNTPENLDENREVLPF